MRRRFTSRYLAAHYPQIYHLLRTTQNKGRGSKESFEKKSRLGRACKRFLYQEGLDDDKKVTFDFDDMGNIIIEQ